MARNRRRRRAQAQDPSLEEITDALEPEEAPAPLDLDPEEAPPPDEAEDHSCLIHHGLNLDTRCDRCGVVMCQMCACPHRTELLCAECLEAQGSRRREGGVWRGLTALGLGLAALAVVTAPLAFTMDGEAVAAMPGGRTFLIYGPMLMGVLGVIIGASAQDFAGLTRRAGLLGVALCALSILFILLLNLSKALG